MNEQEFADLKTKAAETTLQIGRCYETGDGIGKEITEAAVAVLKKADAKFGLSLEYDYHDAGGTAYDKFGTPLPEETLVAAKASDGVLFGAVGGIEV